MKKSAIIVRATWDEDARVWVAQTSDVAGLAAEAPTFEALREKVMAMLPELLELNGADPEFPEFPVHIVAEQSGRIVNPAYR